MALDEGERLRTIRLLKKGGYRVPRELLEGGSAKISNKDKKRMELFLTTHDCMVVALRKRNRRSKGLYLYTYEGYKHIKEGGNGKGKARKGST